MSLPNRAPLSVVLFSGSTADETMSMPVDVSGYTNIAIYLIGTGTITSGVLVTNEGVFDPATKQPFDPAKTSAIADSAVNASELTGGLMKAVHLPAAAYGYIQQRISTAIGGGGSVTAVLVAS